MGFDNNDEFLEDEVYDDDFILEWVECKLSEKDQNYEKCEDCKFRDECLDFAEFCCDSHESFTDSFTGCGRSINDFWDEID